MASMLDRIATLERKMQFVEEQLGIEPSSINTSIPLKNQTIQVQPEPEKLVSGFGKEQLRIMLSWAKGMRLDQLTRGDFEELRKWEMLKEFFPQSPYNYDEIKR